MTVAVAWSSHLRVKVSAPNNDEVLHPAADEDAPVGVHPSEVSRAEKRRPVVEKRACGNVKA